MFEVTTKSARPRRLCYVCSPYTANKGARRARRNGKPAAVHTSSGRGRSRSRISCLVERHRARFGRVVRPGAFVLDWLADVLAKDEQGGHRYRSRGWSRGGEWEDNDDRALDALVHGRLRRGATVLWSAAAREQSMTAFSQAELMVRLTPRLDEMFRSTLGCGGSATQRRGRILMCGGRAARRRARSPPCVPWTSSAGNAASSSTASGGGSCRSVAASSSRSRRRVSGEASSSASETRSATRPTTTRGTARHVRGGSAASGHEWALNGVEFDGLDVVVR